MHQNPLCNDLADDGVTWFHDSSHVAPCFGFWHGPDTRLDSHLPQSLSRGGQ